MKLEQKFMLRKQDFFFFFLKYKINKTTQKQRQASSIKLLPPI
jgi:hypothetical protein